jgi:uncharacterized protein (TIGR03382 family)
MSRRLALASTLVAFLTPAAAQAHWCDDLWISNYNLVIRPVTDTVTVPSSGSATLDIFVQNNMGYPLYNFDLKATATGYTVKVSRQAPKVARYLMPGEKLKHTLTISKSGGGSMSATDLSFSVSFGTGGQSAKYPSGGGKAAMVRMPDGSLVPAPPPPGMTSNRVNDGNPQSAHLLFSSQADYGTLSSALDGLMKEYCVGRPGWDHNNYTGPTTNLCSNVTDASTYKCSTSTPSSSTTKFDWQRLWSAMELAYRKSELGNRLAPFRKGLQCGWNDTNFAFKSFAGFVLGYLGDDPTARSFLEGVVGSGTADEKAVAKAALLMMGTTSHHADVVSCAASSNVYVAAVCQASLAIVDKDDAIVSNKLLPKVSWTEPDTNANGDGLFQSHLVALVAWNRRQWAPNANDKGQVCFYEDCSGGSSGGGSSGGGSSGGGSSSGGSSGSGGSSSGGSDTTPPAAPSGVTCGGTTDTGFRVSWSKVTQDEQGGSEGSVSYKLYYGNSARPTSATTPNDFSYSHSDAATTLSKEYSNMDKSKTYYFSVVAVDAAGNVSRYSKEVSCVPGAAGADDPNAGPNCDLATVTPTSGKPPLKVKLDASKCTPQSGLSLYWRIPTKWIAVEAETTFDTATAEFTFPVEAGAGDISIDLFASANGQETTFPFTVKLLPAVGPDQESGCGCTKGGGGLLPAGGAIALLAFLRRRRTFAR